MPGTTAPTTSTITAALAELTNSETFPAFAPVPTRDSTSLACVWPFTKLTFEVPGRWVPVA